MIPEHVLKNLKCKTAAEFERMKRNQARAVLDAFKAFRRGSACVPGYSHSHTAAICAALEQLVEDVSVKSWREYRKKQREEGRRNGNDRS